MAKKRTAFKRRMSEPIAWEFLHDRRVVFYNIETEGKYDTPDGRMIAVRLRKLGDGVSHDVAALVAKADLPRHLTRELWFWADKFWMKAVNKMQIDYMSADGCFLFYEVQVADPDVLLGGLCHKWQN